MCGDELYSRAQHDFRCCSCGGVFVDGGFDYLRFGCPAGVPPADIRVRVRYVAATRRQLYDDWNNRRKRFGFVRRGLN